MNSRSTLKPRPKRPLPSWADVAEFPQSLLCSHTSWSTRLSLSSLSRAQASWQRRGPNVPSF